MERHFAAPGSSLIPGCAFTQALASWQTAGSACPLDPSAPMASAVSGPSQTRPALTLVPPGRMGAVPEMLPMIADVPRRPGEEEPVATYQLCDLGQVTASLSISHLSNVSSNCTATIPGKTQDDAADKAHSGSSPDVGHLCLLPVRKRMLREAKGHLPMGHSPSSTQ